MYSEKGDGRYVPLYFHKFMIGVLRYAGMEATDIYSQ